jgi:hypothetical protein
VSPALSRAAEEHREAVAACAGDIRRIEACDWNCARVPGKWTPAQIAEHLAIAYDPLLSELSGGSGFRVVVPFWQRAVIRWTILPRIVRGRFPPNAPAPREVRPAGVSPDPETAAKKLTDRAGSFLEALARAAESGRVRLTHAYFGRLSGFQALKLLTTHLHHHRRQLPCDIVSP